MDIRGRGHQRAGTSRVTEESGFRAHPSPLRARPKGCQMSRAAPGAGTVANDEVRLGWGIGKKVGPASGTSKEGLAGAGQAAASGEGVRKGTRPETLRCDPPQNGYRRPISIARAPQRKSGCPSSAVAHDSPNVVVSQENDPYRLLLELTGGQASFSLSQGSAKTAFCPNKNVSRREDVAGDGPVWVPALWRNESLGSKG